jgi:cytochrome c oxidase subunit 4
VTPHVLPLKVYVGVFVGLLVLTALTTWIAFQDLGAFNTPVALLIAGVKAGLVVLWFMHLRGSEKLVWLCALASLLWLLIFFAFTLSDFLTRPILPGWLSGV